MELPDLKAISTCPPWTVCCEVLQHLSSLNPSTIVDKYCVERFVELPDFDGNIDLSILDIIAAKFRGTIGLGHFGASRLWISIGIIFGFILSFITNFQGVQIWI